MPGVPVPYVSGIIETDDGTTVRGNVVGVDPETIDFSALGSKLKLTTWVAGTDDNGTEAVSYTVISPRRPRRGGTPWQATTSGSSALT